MYQDFLPIIIFTGLAVLLIGLPLGLQYILSPRKNKGGDKLISYECGDGIINNDVESSLKALVEHTELLNIRDKKNG